MKKNKKKKKKASSTSTKQQPPQKHVSADHHHHHHQHDHRSGNIGTHAGTHKRYINNNRKKDDGDDDIQQILPAIGPVMLSEEWRQLRRSTAVAGKDCLLLEKSYRIAEQLLTVLNILFAWEEHLAEKNEMKERAMNTLTC